MESAARTHPVAPENEEATEAWSGVLFDRFVVFRELILPGLAQFSDEALRLHPPKPGNRVLDIGCGFGDTTRKLAGMVGAEGEAVGVDIAEPFIETSTAEAAEARAENVRFMAGDVQVMELPGRFDYVFSRMGVMFFANPVAALRNVREAMAPGGRMCIVVWRRKLDNPWLRRAEEVANRHLEEPDETDEPTCGPGPFSMADADTVSSQLLIAGFDEPTFTRFDRPMKLGDHLDQAVALNMSLGPAGELIRLAADEADRIRPTLEREIREVLADFEREDGSVHGNASIWIVTATAP
jgi:SAM-dependent methyltransferase